MEFSVVTSNTSCFWDVNERIDIDIKVFNGLSCADDTSLRNGGRHVTRRRPEYIYLTTQKWTHSRLA